MELLLNEKYDYTTIKTPAKLSFTLQLHRVYYIHTVAFEVYSLNWVNIPLTGKMYVEVPSAIVFRICGWSTKFLLEILKLFTAWQAVLCSSMHI